MKRAARITNLVGGVVASVAMVIGLGALARPAAALDGQGSLQGEPVALEEPSAPVRRAVRGDAGSTLLVAQATTIQSGLTTQQKPTLSELRRFYASIPDYPIGNALWSVMPDVGAYKAGTLSDAALTYASKYLAMIRYAANLGSVSFDVSLNASAAEGGLILARLDTMTHQPATPSGVSDAQAEAGKYACENSNLSTSWGKNDILGVAIQGQIDDKSATNMDRLGHRRWLLNPNTTTMGIGSAKSDSGKAYTAVRVMGDGVGENSSVDYSYVAWPPSGAFLSELFEVGVPWSVTLNPSKYEAPTLSGVTVTISRQSDGRSWTLDAADNNLSSGEYFNVNNAGYGVNNCIVFNPGGANLGVLAYEGLYHVRVAGLRTADGVPATLEYDVDFAAATADIASVAAVTDIPDQAYTGSAVCPEVVVTEGGQVLTEGVDYTVSYEDNVSVGTATVIVTGIGAYSGSITKSFEIKRGEIASGTWGTCPWVVDADGKLTIGAGCGADTESTCPWGGNDVCEAITSATFDADVVLPADCSNLFSGCSSLASLDVSGWDTSSVTNMAAVFWGCSSLSALDTSRWNTSSVTNMWGMFNGCASLASLDVSGWDTSSATNMGYLFYGCCSLASLDVSGWDTSRVTNIRRMFRSCSSLAFLDLSGFDTSNVTDMGSSMFSGCTSLCELKVGDGYQFKSVDMFPDATADSGWWSVADGRWYTKGEVVSSRSGVPDTYLSSAPGPDLSRDGWVTLPSGAKGYARGGSLVTGWLTLGDDKFWFASDGAAAEGWTEVGGSAYYFREGGDCRMARGWATIGGNKVLFRADGRLGDGWVSWGGERYYADRGVPRAGWQDLAEGRYYFREDGTYRMAAGWATTGGRKLLFRADGRLADGWVTLGDNKYYADAGVPRTDWQDVGGRRRYFRADGRLAVGWATIGGYQYWFDPHGVAVTGTVEIGSKEYVFDAEGRRVG